MKMKINDYSNETIGELLSVSKKILGKAEILIDEVPFYDRGSFWFKPVGENIEYDLVIRKLDKLSVLTILDEKYVSSIPVPITYKLELELSIFRDFIKDLEFRLKQETQEKFISAVSWPDYYKWDKTNNSFMVGDGRKFTLKKESFRWKVFNSLVSRKGEPVLVATIAKESGIKDEGEVRVVINQIRDKIKKNGLNDYLKIESLSENKTSTRGAYRILP